MSMLSIRAALEAQLDTVAPIIPAVPFTVSGGANALFTCATPHGLLDGVPVRVTGYTGGTPGLTGMYLFKRVSSTTFYLQDSATKAYIGVTIAGSGGSILASLTAYQNAMYQTVIGIPYQLIHLVPFKPDEPTQGAGYYREHGVFQVTLVYPAGRGIGAILSRAEVIRNSFKKGFTFVYGGITTTIFETPEFGLIASDQHDITLPVKIGYWADVYN